MGENSSISWTDHTFNPWIGCTKVSAGCAHCYAERDMDLRRGKVIWGPLGTRVMTSEAYWEKPMKWDRDAEKNGTRPRVFCASLADVFENWDGEVHDHQGNAHYTSDSNPDRVATNAQMKGSVSDGYHYTRLDDVRARLFRLIDATPNLDWLLLTKRPENILRMWPDYTYNACATGDCPHDRASDCSTILHRENVWIGASVEDQENADKRIPGLLKCRDLAPVLFLSAEPLLGPVDLCKYLDGINWVIAGGESGPKSRPVNAHWLRRLRDDCAVKGVPFHLKQWGEYLNFDRKSPCLLWDTDCQETGEARIHSAKVDGRMYCKDDIEFDPDDNSVYVRVGKKRSGRQLDGFEHNGFPQQNAT